MTMTAERREQAATELRRFAADLHLTEEQKWTVRHSCRSWLPVW